MDNKMISHEQWIDRVGRVLKHAHDLELALYIEYDLQKCYDDNITPGQTALMIANDQFGNPDLN